MLGDFNEWSWPVRSMARLGASSPPARTRHATFPSWYPLLRLDRIFCWPPGALRASFVDQSARRASDHLPVIADIAPARRLDQRLFDRSPVRACGLLDCREGSPGPVIHAAGHRDGLCHWALHLPRLPQATVRGGRHRRHGAEGVRWSRRVPRRRRRDRARHNGAQDRRPLQGSAIDPREDAARLRHARFRRHAPLCAHRGWPRVSHHLQYRRGGWRATRRSSGSRLRLHTSFPATIPRCSIATRRPGLEGWVSRVVEPKQA
jgi:hypothetical protein